jgi:hypothetical protein
VSSCIPPYPRTGPCEWCGDHSNRLRGPSQSPEIPGPPGRLLRCSACYRYLWRTGSERPLKLIQRALR